MIEWLLIVREFQIEKKSRIWDMKNSENLRFPVESFVPQTCLATLLNKEIRCQGQFDYFL